MKHVRKYTTALLDTTWIKGSIIISSLFSLLNREMDL